MKLRAGLTLVLLLLAAACVQTTNTVPPASPPPPPAAMMQAAPAPGGCPGGKGNPNADVPIICVDNAGSNFSVDPPTIIVNDVDSFDRKSPVVIHWMLSTKSADDLSVKWKGNCIIDEPVCRGNGCRAVTKPGVTGQCEYEVVLGSKKIDPVVIITNCCVGGP